MLEWSMLFISISSIVLAIEVLFIGLKLNAAYALLRLIESEITRLQLRAFEELKIGKSDE